MTQRIQRIDLTAASENLHFRFASACLMACGLVLFSGCQTLAGPQNLSALSGGSSAEAGSTATSQNPIAQVSGETPRAEKPVAEKTLAEKTKKTSTQIMNLVSGRELENATRSRQLYQEADAVFRSAQKLEKEDSKSTFKKSAKLFKRAGEAAPGTALEQDALFMQAESLFFADRLTEATDVYERLQKRFPRNRHIDRVAARLFSISRYWIDTVKSEQNGWFPINLTDPKRPRMDIDGHAIRVLDQIRFDDPTGRLADDATMAAAAEYIRQQKFEEADEFLTDLRETFSDSEHLFLAHLLGIRCKLETYAGPFYSGLVLEEAETLVRQTRQRFPDKLADAQYGDMVARAAAEIAYLRAERLAYRAEYREKRKEFGAARYYYQLLLERFADTPQADTVRQRLAEIEELPAIPKQRLAWLTTIFAERDRSTPLESKQPTSESSETVLR